MDDDNLTVDLSKTIIWWRFTWDTYRICDSYCCWHLLQSPVRLTEDSGPHHILTSEFLPDIWPETCVTRRFDTLFLMQLVHGHRPLLVIGRNARWLHFCIWFTFQTSVSRLSFIQSIIEIQEYDYENIWKNKRHRIHICVLREEVGVSITSSHTRRMSRKSFGVWEKG